MSKVKTVLGKDLMLFVNSKAIALATSCKLSVSAETIDTQSKDSGIWTESDVKKLSWECSSDNLFSADATANSYDKLFAMMLERKPVPIVFGIAANADEAEVPEAGWTPPTGAHYSGLAIITSLEANAPDGDKATLTVSLKGTGALAQAGASGASAQSAPIPKDGAGAGK